MSHTSWQVPVTQLLPAAHAVPAEPPVVPQPAVAPQWISLGEGSVQTPPQRTSPPPQLVLHDPAVQTVPAPHVAPAEPPVVPQPDVAPQYALLVVGSTQVPLQVTWPAAHVRVHTPALQTVPPPQTDPEEPPAVPQPAVAPQ